MNRQIFFSAVILLGVFSACQSNKEEGQKEKVEKVQTIDNETEFENRIAAIENNPELIPVRSLSYNNNAGSTAEAIGYLDKDQKEVKIEEKFSYAETGNYGTNTFYVENGTQFASKEVYYDNTGAKPLFIERISFYEKGKVIFTKERKADVEEDLINTTFQVIPAKALSVDRAMQIINQQGPFETTFQGFAEGGGMKYLLVGENSAEGYASSLAIQYQEGDIVKLMKNEKKMIGTPLIVNHEVMTDNTGLTFQVLITVKIK
ncbi:MAG: hypothetical protein RLZ33_2796 [Bacteroidota bacterium]|jgi:hypothetical protein